MVHHYITASTVHSTWLTAAILKMDVTLMQNNMQITVIWSKSKPVVEFQYGGRFFLIRK